MRFEIRKSGGPTCPHCGATELVTTAATEAELRRDLHEAITAIAPSRWRLLERRAVKHLRRLHDDHIEQLKQLTHYV